MVDADHGAGVEFRRRAGTELATPSAVVAVSGGADPGPLALHRGMTLVATVSLFIGTRVAWTDAMESHRVVGAECTVTLADEETTVLSVGRYLDVVVAEGDSLAFARKICVYDNPLVTNSLVYPL